MIGEVCFMSAKLMGLVWDLDIPHPMAWVLMALADHADHDGGSLFVGQRLLSWKTGYSERQIRRILEQLELAKIIIPEDGGRGRGLKQNYRIIMDNAPRKPKMDSTKKRTKWPVNSDDDSGEKPDNMTGLNSEKSGQNGHLIADKMAGFPEAKSGHFDQEKRTFCQQKADISDISHDKERARIEPSIEPSKEPSCSPASASPTRQPKTKKESEVKEPKEPDFAVQIFNEAYLKFYQSPYQDKRGDYVRLAELRKKYAAADWEINEQRWRVAVENYFASDLGAHTLADLCARFSPFYKGALDRYGQRPQQTGNHHSSKGGPGNAATQKSSGTGTTADRSNWKQWNP